MRSLREFLKGKPFEVQGAILSETFDYLLARKRDIDRGVFELGRDEYARQNRWIGKALDETTQLDRKYCESVIAIIDDTGTWGGGRSYPIVLRRQVT